MQLRLTIGPCQGKEAFINCPQGLYGEEDYFVGFDGLLTAFNESAEMSSW